MAFAYNPLTGQFDLINASSGGGTVSGIGTLDSGTPGPNGATIVGNNLVLQSASATEPGLVNTTTQSFAGNKTFFGTIAATNLSGNNTGDVTLGTADGLSLSGQVLSLQLADATHTGALSSSDWNKFNSAGAAFTIGALDAAAENANGLAFSSNVLSAQSADATHPGMVNNTTQTFSGTKTFSSAPKISTMTSGSILFAGTSGIVSQNNANLIWDDANAGLCLGSTSSLLEAGVPTRLLISNTGSAYPIDIGILRYSASQGAVNAIGRSRGTGASPTAVQNLDDAGSLLYLGYDGVSAYQGCAVVSAIISDPSPGPSSMGGELHFATTQIGSTSQTLAMKIDNTQNARFLYDTFCVNSTSTGRSSATLGFVAGTNGGTGGALVLNGASTGAVTVEVGAAAGTYAFNLPTTAGSAGQYLTSQGGGVTAMTWTTPPTPLTLGNLTSTDVTVGNGTGAVIGSGTTLTLATVNSNTGSFGSSTSIPTFTVNGKGLITAASGNVVIAPAGTLTGTTLNSTVVTSSLTSVGTQAQALNMGSHLINNVTDPSGAQDAATKNYVDTQLAALNPADACYAASTANIAGTYNNGVAGIGATFTTTATTAFAIDGTSPSLGNRILIKDQSGGNGFQNGIYTFTTQAVGGISGAILTRALDYNTPAEMNTAGLIPIINGTVNALTAWLQTATITTIGTDLLVFTEYTANPSLYMLKANNLNDVASASTSFNNISGLTAAGDIIVGGASGARSKLALGTANQVLGVNNGGTTLEYKTISTSGTAVSNDVGITLTNANSIAINLPSASTTVRGVLTSADWNTFNGKGSGSVTSVGISVPGSSIFGTSGSPVTTSGTLGITTTGSSGGIPYFSSTSVLSSSAALTANQLIVGGGAGTTPATLAAGSQYQVLTMGAANPGYGAVNLAQSAAVTGILPNANTTATAAGTASTIVSRDSNSNSLINNLTENLTSTATAAGTTTLTVSSAGMQQFTGTTTQTVVLPDCTTLAVGVDYEIFNRSNAAIIVNANGGGLLQLIESGNQATFVCTNIGSGPGAWDISYTVNGLTLGKVLALSMGLALN